MCVRLVLRQIKEEGLYAIYTKFGVYCVEYTVYDTMTNTAIDIGLLYTAEKMMYWRIK